MLEKLTAFTRRFAHHPHALIWLFFYSVIESVFFPVPPDVLLVPLTIARPARALYFSTIAALGSATGGIIGYMIGFYAFEPTALPLLTWLCQYSASACPATVVPLLNGLFAEHGVGVIAVSSISPLIPYRFTILAAGLGHMPLVPFAIVSFLAHWLRYSIVSYVAARYGRQSIELIKTRLPLAFVVFGVLGIGYYLLVEYL